LVLLLIGGGAAAFFLLGSNDEEASAPVAQQQDAGKPEKKKSSKKSTDHLTIGPMYPMAQFVVNLLSESGNRFLKVAVDLELSDAKLQPEMDQKKSLIRDIIIRTFSSKTFEEISTLKGKDKLKDEVLDKINQNLSDGHVKNIFFTDFVVQ
jgi:flagellar FliL protein